MTAVHGNCGGPLGYDPDRRRLTGVNVVAKNSVARLIGTVPAGMQRLEAAVVEGSTLGIGSVQDDLCVAD